MAHFKKLISATVAASWLVATPSFAQMVDTSPHSEREDRIDYGDHPSGGAKITRDVDIGSDPDLGDPNDLHDAYQPKGLEVGSFLLLPTFELNESYNDNLYATKSDRKGVFITDVNPAFQMRSRFRRHAINLSGDLSYLYYKGYPNDNRVDMSLTSDGYFELDSNNRLTMIARSAYLHEDRGSPDDQGGKSPTPTWTSFLQVGSQNRFGQTKLSPSLRVQRSVFYDVEADAGTTINNDDRDRWEYKGTVNVTRSIYPGYGWVTEVSGDVRDYDEPLDDSGFDRSSYGFWAATGVGVDLTDLVRGDFLLGYMGRNYADGALNDTYGPTLRAVFHWSPNKVTLVSPSIQRSIQETTLNGASSIVRSTASVAVRYEAARNIILGGSLTFNRDAFEGVNRADNTYAIEGNATYAFSPEIYTRFEMGYKKKQSTNSDIEFDQTVVGVSLGLRM